jgi:hypothetical protein
VTGALRVFKAQPTLFMTRARFAGVPVPALQVATFKECVNYPGLSTHGVNERNRPS